MGPDLSSPPTWSFHQGSLDPTHPWLTSRLTAVTPDFTRTYDQEPSSLANPFGSLYAGFAPISDERHAVVGSDVGYNDGSVDTFNAIFLADYSVPSQSHSAIGVDNLFRCTSSSVRGKIMLSSKHLRSDRTLAASLAPGRMHI